MFPGMPPLPPMGSLFGGPSLECPPPPDHLFEDLPDGVNANLIKEAYMSGYGDGHSGEDSHLFQLDLEPLQPAYDVGYRFGKSDALARESLGRRHAAQRGSWLDDEPGDDKEEESFGQRAWIKSRPFVAVLYNLEEEIHRLARTAMLLMLLREIRRLVQVLGK